MKTFFKKIIKNKKIMAEFTIKTFDEKIHNIYLNGEVDKDMWQTLIDNINVAISLLVRPLPSMNG